MSDRWKMHFAALALLTALAAVPIIANAQTVTGTWETRVWNGREDAERRDWVNLNLRMDRNGRGSWNSGFTIGADELEGVSLADLRGSLDDARFEIVREAGTFSFDGSIRRGRGTGFFTFQVDANYVQAMRNAGFGDLDDDDLLALATQDVTTDYVQQIRALGYDLGTRDLVKFAIHGVSVEFIHDMNDLGYVSIPADDLVTLRIHGVSPEYVRRVREALGVS